VTSNPSSVAQWAAVEALTGSQNEIREMAAEFDARRRLIVDGLNGLPGVACVIPRVAFYAFPNVSGLFGRRAPSTGAVLRTSSDVASFLLTDAQVAVVPGVDFGSDTHVRLSYATGTDLIREGLRRMEKAIQGLQ